MTIEEISRAVAQRILQGSMHHEQFSNYYHFLGLEGYKSYHEYHFMQEIINYKQFINYIMYIYNKFIPKISFQKLSSITIIPSSWYEHTREDVDMATIRTSVKNGLEKYMNWERDTKKFLEDMMKQAMNIGEVYFVEKIRQIIKDIDQEIKIAEKEYLQIKATDYDMPTIISRQIPYRKEYKKKIKE